MMNSLIHRHLLLPAFETIFKGRKTLAHWSDLERTQWLPRAAIEELQFQALRRLVHHAYENCSYYRQTWKHFGLHPGSLDVPPDIVRWPVIDRETIRAHRSEMRAAHTSLPLITKSTGGSSGVPLQFEMDRDSHERRTAASHRGYGWAGAAPGTKQLYLWGVSLGAGGLRTIKDNLYRRFHRQRVVSCFNTGNDLAGRFSNELNRYRPDVIVAYTNPLYEVARRLEERGVYGLFRPAAIVVGAEKLHEFQRELIERVFRAPVFETYGSREFMLIGAECERRHGLHLTAEHLLVEILDDQGHPTPHGQEGNVVITDLYNYGMPFVRYANGDRAIAGLGECQCGRGLPLLKKVVGRRLDVLHATGGRVLAGEFFPHLVKDFPAVRRFQIVQEDARLVRFTMVEEGMRDSEKMRLEHLVRSALGPEVHVEFERVAQIALTSAGKLQVVINKLSQRKAG